MLQNSSDLLRECFFPVASTISKSLAMSQNLSQFVILCGCNTNKNVTAVLVNVCYQFSVQATENKM